MVTWRRLALGLAVLSGCNALTSGEDRPLSSSGTAANATASNTPGKIPPGTVEPGGTGPQYPGHGFIVHEWGTNTIVVGSDGAMVRGLHHEEEDLPAFVYDRRSPSVARSVDVKMETPVAYFYSDKPLEAHVDVSF